jgi:hypothetical protein
MSISPNSHPYSGAGPLADVDVPSLLSELSGADIVSTDALERRKFLRASRYLLMVWVFHVSLDHLSPSSTCETFQGVTQLVTHFESRKVRHLRPRNEAE